jgi:hypothetical protein
MREIQWLARLSGAGLLGATAGIHAHLWAIGYRAIPKIGPLFMANVVIGSLLCLAVAVGPNRLLGWAALAGAGFEVGTLAGLAISVNHGLFGFRDGSGAPLFWQSVGVEIAGTIVLAALAASLLTRMRARARVSVGHA